MNDPWGMAFGAVGFLMLFGYAGFMLLGVDPLLALAIVVGTAIPLGIVFRVTLSAAFPTVDNQRDGNSANRGSAAAEPPPADHELQELA